MHLHMLYFSPASHRASPGPATLPFQPRIEVRSGILERTTALSQGRSAALVAPDRFRLVVIGLDSVSPDLLFRRFASVTPRIQRLLATSRRGALTSCDPPITVPAWAVMFSGADPGTLGLYGFRHRRPGSYTEMCTPTSATPRRSMVWHQLSREGKKVAVLGMPPGYPPPAVNGVSISDFLTPEAATDWANPPRYRDELQRVAGGTFFDVPFRVSDRREVARELFEMTRRRWKVARHLWPKQRWDLFAIHEIGPDRLHHTFWKYFDPEHPRYERNSEFAQVASDYYALLDEEIGAFLDALGDDVSVLIVSDHGSQAMQGCFCVNEWLIREGLLVLHRAPRAAGTPLEEAEVDWGRTSVWAAGGYYARIFFNVKGREPDGIVEPADIPRLTEELRARFTSLRRPDGAFLGVRLFAPKDVYQRVEGDPPDLMAYFDHTRWRSAGTLGHARLFLEENDTGPDDAVHSFEGILAWHEAGRTTGAELDPQRIIDLAPTIIRRFGGTVAPEVQGRPIEELLLEGS